MLTEVTGNLQFCKLRKCVINLPHRTDRLKQFISEVLHLKIERDGIIIVPGRIKEIPSEGIGMSHREAMDTAFRLGDYVLIMEDDVIFPGMSKTIPHIDKCLENVPEKWDILLGGVYNQNGIKKYNDYWNKLEDFRGLHFYIINRKAYEKIKAGYKFNDHIDKWISENGFNVYVMNPFCAMQRDGYSDNVKFVTKYNKLYWRRFNILKP